MKLFISLLLIITTTNVFAGKAEVISSLSKYFKNISEKDINKAPVKNLYEVTIGGDIVYVSKDGKYLISGEIIDLKSQANLTNLRKAMLVKSILNTVDDNEKIIFKAQKEKYAVNVFTDVDCPFCKKLHANMKEYNKLGITIKYLASPLASLHPKALARMESIWCAKDRKTAIDVYKKTGRIVAKSCKNNSVREQLKIAESLGVRGTPTVFLPNGRKISGFIKPKVLLAELQRLN